MKERDKFAPVRFLFAVFSLVSLVVIGVEGFRHGIGISTLTMRAAVVVVGIRIVSTFIVGVLRGYEETQGS